MKKIIPLDCREMEPPEPMLQVFHLIEQLKEGEQIQMLHRIAPYPLYDKLKERGCSYRQEGKEHNYTIWIWKE